MLPVKGSARYFPPLPSGTKRRKGRTKMFISTAYSYGSQNDFLGHKNL